MDRPPVNVERKQVLEKMYVRCGKAWQGEEFLVGSTSLISRINMGITSPTTVNGFQCKMEPEDMK